MFVVMSLGASEEALNAVRSLILDEGLTPHENRGAGGTVIAVLGEGGARLERLGTRLRELPGVASVTRTDRPFKLTSRAFHPEDTVVEVGRVRIGDGSLTIMAGPCAVESREQLFETADAVAAAGADMLRGGAFKPRTSPYSFQGLGLHGLRLLAEARERTGLPGDHRGDGARRRSNLSPSTPTSSRSAPGTCRTTRCSWRSARSGGRCSSSVPCPGRSRSGSWPPST